MPSVCLKVNGHCPWPIWRGPCSKLHQICRQARCKFTHPPPSAQCWAIEHAIFQSAEVLTGKPQTVNKINPHAPEIRPPLGKACRLLNHGPAVIVLAQHGSRKSRNKAFSIDKQKRPITGAFLLWSCCILLFAPWARLLTQLRTETLKALEVSCPDNIQYQSNDYKNNRIN